MSKNADISKLRNELKVKLKAGNNTTLVDVVLRWIGRGKPASPMAGTLILFGLPIFIGFLVAVTMGELEIWKVMIRNLASNSILFLWVIFSLLTATASMILANIYFHRLVALSRDRTLEIAVSQETLVEVESWVDLLCNKRFTSLTGLIGGAVVSPVLISINSNVLGSFVGIGCSLMLFLFAVQSSLFFGLIYGVLLFVLRMNRFDLELFKANPASSEIVTRLSSSLNWFVYLIAAYGALQTFGIVTLKLPYFTLILLLFWIPIATIFIASQFSLAQIIQRAKWKTLNTVQQEITMIQEKKSVLKKEDQENILWLLNYHDRVKATRNSAFDLNAGLNFLNSLLLPFIGFVLGNFDKVLAFFR